MQNVFFQADSDRNGTIDAREIFPALTGAYEGSLQLIEFIAVFN